MAEKSQRRKDSPSKKIAEPAVAAVPTLLALILPWLALLWLGIYGTIFFSSLLPNAQDRLPGLTRQQLLLQLPELYQSFFECLHNPRTPSGPQYLVQRLDILACALFIGLAALALGRLILRVLRLWSVLDRATRTAFAGGLGLGAVSLVTLGLGLAGALSQLLFVALFAGILLAEAVCMIRDRRQPAEPHRLSAALPDSPAPGWIKWPSLLVVIPFLMCMLLGAMLPEMDFDVKEYHLQGPKEYLQDGRIHFLPHNVYTSFPFLTEMLSLAGMVVRGDWERGALVGKTVLMFFAPLTALGVWCVARRLSGTAAAWLAVLAYLTTPWVYRISIIALTEGASCCYVILPALALLCWRDLQRSTSPLTLQRTALAAALVTGALAGSAASTKYPGMVFVTVPLCAALVVMAWNEKLPAREILFTLTAYALGVLLAFGPWMAKNFAETGNPVYPLLWSVFGGVDWDAELQDKFRRGHSTTAAAFWNLRAEISSVVIENDWQSPLLFGLAPLAWLWRPRAGLGWLTGYAALILGAWFFLTHRLDRFWVPVIPVLSVLAGIGLWKLLISLDRGEPLINGLLRAPAVCLVLLVTAYNFAFVTTALCGPNGYLTDLPTLRRQSTTPAIALLESLQLPAGSKVLMVGEAQVFNAHFPLLYNTVFDFSLLEQQTGKLLAAGKWELLPAEDIHKTWQQLGITHLFVNWQEILRYRTTYSYTDYVSPARMQQLVQAGVLREISLPPDVVIRRLADQPLLYQAQIASWGPELQKDGLVTISQLYEVVR